jgi:tripartite-type tricarboxylate transporter receptor subunit TctC
MTRSNGLVTTISARRWLASALAVAGTLVWGIATTPVQAEPGFPNRTVRIFVPYGPGGVGDLTMRLVAQKLGERMGKQVIIENRPGAAGVLAAKATLDSPPDGYTMLVTGNGTAISMSLFKVRPYNALTDFTQISVAASFEMLIATPVDSPYKTVQDIIKAARANPGKLNLAAINPGSTQNLSAHLFKQLTGIDATIVTYRTTPDLITALLRKDVDVVFDFYAGLQSAIADNKIHIAASSDETRNPLLPNVPTAKESGLPDYVVTSWNALSAPAGLPDDVLKILNREINAALADPDLQVKAKQFGMNARGSTPEEMRARMARDIDRWAGVIEKAGIAKQ